MADERTWPRTFRLTQNGRPAGSIAAPAPGTVLGERFRIVSLLGRGGMGEVYLAEDTRLGLKVALKFLPAQEQRSPAELQMLYREVRLGRQIAHPNVCRLYDLVEIDQQQFVSMEHIEGEDLASLFDRAGRLPHDKALVIAKDICAGLEAIHRAGVLHRDLKPSNILLDARGHAHITDFGIASDVAEQSESGPVVGTPAYMAPEVLRLERPGVRSDLYALGIVLYQLFTGRLPFESQSLEEIVAGREPLSVVPPSHLAPEIDPSVDRIILQCLARDPARRPDSARTVAAALPGADPLQIALAAGETPSRAMVAEAATFRGFGSSALAALTAAVLIGIISIAILGRTTTLYGRAPLLPRGELDRRARAWITQHVPDASHNYRAAWFELDDAVLEEIRVRRLSREIGAMKRSPILYIVRVSPDPLVPRSGMRSDRPPRVSLDDPPHDLAGMATVVIDGLGNLREVRSPRSQRTAPAEVEARSAIIAESVQVVVIALVAVAAVVLVRRNLRLGRGDRVGAFRFATVLFVLSCMDALAGAAWRSSVIGLWWLMAGIVAHALFWSSLMWIAYLALEPIVRRHWPQALAGWTRLFDGRFLDPLVGRDTIAGVAGGVLLALLRHLMVILPERFATAEPLPLVSGIDDLTGIGTALSTVFYRAHTAMFNAVGSLVTFVLLRLLVRNFALAACLWIPLIVIINFGGRTDLVSIALLVVFTVAMLLILNRYGLLALAVALFASFNLRGVLPDFSESTYAIPASLALFVTLGMFAFGAGIALRRTPREVLTP